MIRTWAAGLAVVCALLPACAGNTQMGYVRDSQDRVALKIPETWAQFDQSQFVPPILGQPSTPNFTRWLVAFDAAPNPSPSHVFNQSDLSTDYPDGFAWVFALPPDIRDVIDVRLMRDFLFPVDCFGANDIQVFGYNDMIVLDNQQIRGLHIDFQFRVSALQAAQTECNQPGAGNPPPNQTPFPSGGGTSGLSPGFVHVDQTVYLDARTDKLYLVALMCSSACYARDSGTISSVMSSWTVQP